MNNVDNVSNATVSILSELPPKLHEAMKAFLEARPDWDTDRLISTAIALFIMQNGLDSKSEHYRNAAQVYLKSLFK